MCSGRRSSPRSRHPSGWPRRPHRSRPEPALLRLTQAARGWRRLLSHELMRRLGFALVLLLQAACGDGGSTPPGGTIDAAVGDAAVDQDAAVLPDATPRPDAAPTDN